MTKVDFSTVRASYGPQTVDVDVPQWGGDVTLARATASERMDALVELSAMDLDDEGEPVDKDEMITRCVRIVSQSIVNDDGSRPFDTDDGRQELLDEHLMVLVNLIPAVLAVNAINGSIDEIQETAKKK